MLPYYEIYLEDFILKLAAWGLQYIYQISRTRDVHLY